MGYNTWRSIQVKPLPNRLNIIISKNHLSEVIVSERVKAFTTFEDSLKYLSSIEYHKIFIIGGSQLYKYVCDNYKETIERVYETVSDITYEPKEGDEIIHFELPQLDLLCISKNSRKCLGTVCGSLELRPIQCHFTIYQKSINENEQVYLKLLQNVQNTGISKQSRNSEVLSSFGEKMVFDLRKGFPLLTSKRMGWKTILRELLWFLSGSTDNNDLQANKVHIWDQNAEEYASRSDLEKGDLGPVYGFQWRYFGATYETSSSDYRGTGIDQIKYIIDEIRSDPTSRRLLLSAWNPVDIPHMALPPCHVMVQFSIDDEWIDAQLYQRSGDMFLGVPFNIASYSFLLHIIGNITGYKPRYLHHVLGDAHIYKGHFKATTTQLSRGTFNCPQLVITRNIQDIDSINESYFRIDNYVSDERIVAEMTT